MNEIEPFGISVVVSLKGGILALQATLDSIMAQTLVALEVIVVHGTLSGLSRLPMGRHANRLRVLQVADGDGPTLRNAGLEAARGRLVAFCDSGDLWKPGYLKAMMEMWQVEPRLLLAYGDVVSVRGGMWQAERQFSEAPAGFWDGQRSLGPLMSTFDLPPLLRLLRFQPFMPSALVADRTFLSAEGGWDSTPGPRAGCDLATTLRLARRAPFGIMHRALVGVREDDVSEADLQAIHLGHALVLEQALTTCPQLQAHAAEAKAAIARWRQAALDIAFARGDFRGVQDIAALLPRRERPPPTRLKLGVARWPAPLRRAGSAALLGLRVSTRKPH